ncbi:pilus assembly protein TadG-related protein [Glaciimonas sp. CA11.2]|uniref:pilus assembly protein TadG-related protein n=2 Tax=Glaciimonas sp. CA11.2 TaxID=3048601 RepID=UPI002B23CD79|nr:pilus assembly protein TadG-related protein [Glaciimonas sp. CA11.2]MEB0163649.1 pilus assembly protein TadG-related protein [Glaciimonas sp. CA11.2]
MRRLSPCAKERMASAVWRNSKAVHQHRPSRSIVARQRGAVLPIAIFFAAVLCLGLFAVYNMAQVTSEKRQLTNAADAIAYSTANVAAEGLNYTSYTNRAMIANYQAVGQMTAMWSNMTMSEEYWKNNSVVMKAVAALVKYIPYIGTGLSGVLNAVSKFSTFWDKIVDGVRVTSQVLANVGTATTSLTNYAIFASQQVHLATTASAMISMQSNLLAANAPQAEYIPQTIVYQIGKSMVDFGSMIKLHQPPRKFLGDTVMKTDMPNSTGIKHNMVHALMMDEMFGFTSNMAGRRLFPNAVGLWTVDGCNLSAINGILTGLSTNGLEQIIPALAGNTAADVIGPVIEAFMNTVGIIASPIMCLYERTGGSRVIQMQDGTYAWSNIDIMEINPHLFNIHIPMAGAVTMSKVGRQGLDKNQEIPDDLKKFVDVVNGNDAWKRSFWGEAVAIDDCMYFTLPTGGVYAPRLGGACASLNAGVAKKYYDRGVMNIAESSADRAMKGQAQIANATEVISNAATATLAPIIQAVGSSINSTSSASSLINLADANAGNTTGVLGGAPAGLPASGSALNAPTPGSGDPAVGIASGLAQQAANFANLSSQGNNVSSAVSNVLGNGFTLPNMSFTDPVNAPDAFTQFLLKALGLSDLIDVLGMRTSRGTETLFQKPGLGGVIAADMGLPAERFGFWEMRHANLGNYRVQNADRANGDSSNIFLASKEVQNNALKDIGPSFVVALQETAEKLPLRSESKFNLGRAPLKDYDAETKQSYLKAIGKARVYYRAPVERWTSRMQVMSHANLILPYWNARLEGLNYPEKSLFFLID